MTALNMYFFELDCSNLVHNSHFRISLHHWGFLSPLTSAGSPVFCIPYLPLSLLPFFEVNYPLVSSEKKCKEDKCKNLHVKNVFIIPSHLIGSFTGYSILGWKYYFSLVFIHCFLDSGVTF